MLKTMFFSFTGNLLLRGSQVIAVLAIVTLIVSCRVFERFTLPTPTSPPKQITTNSLPLNELWRWSGYVNEILIKNDKIIVVSSEQEGRRIKVFDARTGNLIWESPPTFENVDSLAVDNKNVYGGYTQYVQAFDLETGQKLWKGAQQSKYKKGALYVYAQEERIEVYDASSNWPFDERMFVLDAETGETVETLEWPRIFLNNNKMIYSRTGPVNTGVALVAQDKSTRNILWNFPTRMYP